MGTDDKGASKKKLLQYLKPFDQTWNYLESHDVNANVLKAKVENDFKQGKEGYTKSLKSSDDDDLYKEYYFYSNKKPR